MLLSLHCLESRDWLEFAGIAPTKYPTLSKEQHFAEKIHAYTLPREENRPNSRVKDLIDLVLLIETDELVGSRIITALEATFKRRGTHSLPNEIPDPPVDWDRPYQSLADEVGLEHDLDHAVSVVRKFFSELANG